jgi:hypothetical protein
MGGCDEPRSRWEQKACVYRFSTVFDRFAGAADPESFGISSAWRTAPFFAPLKNGENGGRHV